MSGGCGVGAFCSFCGKCGRVFTSVVSGIEAPHVAPPGVAMTPGSEEGEPGAAVSASSSRSVSAPKHAAESGRTGAEERDG